MYLTSKERIASAINRKEVDRIPVFPIVHTCSPELIGETIKNFAQNENIMAKSLLNAQEKFGYDGIIVGVDPVIEAEALGSTTFQPQNEPASVIKHFIEKKSDLKKIRRRVIPEKEGRMPVIINATKIIKKALKNNIFIQSVIMGPMNLATQLRGVHNLIFDFIDDPDFANELLELCLGNALEYGKALINAGADNILIGEAFCSLNVISPKIYREFAMLKQKRLVGGLKEYNDDITIDLHICGNVVNILEDMVNTTADIFDIDWQVDMGLACKYCTCRGNLDPSAVLFLGNKELVLKKSKEVIDKAAKSKALILGSGCDIPPGTLFENITAMTDAVKLYS